MPVTVSLWTPPRRPHPARSRRSFAGRRARSWATSARWGWVRWCAGCAGGLPVCVWVCAGQGKIVGNIGQAGLGSLVSRVVGLVKVVGWVCATFVILFSSNQPNTRTHAQRAYVHAKYCHTHPTHTQRLNCTYTRNMCMHMGAGFLSRDDQETVHRVRAVNPECEWSSVK